VDEEATAAHSGSLNHSNRRASILRSGTVFPMRSPLAVFLGRTDPGLFRNVGYRHLDDRELAEVQDLVES